MEYSKSKLTTPVLQDASGISFWQLTFFNRLVFKNSAFDTTVRSISAICLYTVRKKERRRGSMC